MVFRTVDRGPYTVVVKEGTPTSPANEGAIGAAPGVGEAQSDPTTQSDDAELTSSEPSGAQSATEVGSEGTVGDPSEADGVAIPFLGAPTTNAWLSVNVWFQSTVNNWFQSTAGSITAAESEAASGAAVTDPVGGPPEVEPAPVVPVLDACDESIFSGVDWATHESDHFTFYYLPGTSAERDIEEIAAVREAAYSDIRSALSLTEEPHVDVYLSPNRLAARARHRGFGVAYQGKDRYEVIYTGDPESYEVTHYGHELTHVLSYYADPSGMSQTRFMSEGLAEVLDDSGRDYHSAYAQRLNGGLEDRLYLTGFDERDPNGRNRGRGGSFVSHVLEDHGIEGVLALIQATHVTWTSGCYAHETVGCINSADSLGALMEYGSDAALGQSWESVRAAWELKVRHALENETAELEGEDRAEVENLLAVADAALESDDAEAYRATMEGFYCEWGDGDTGRMEIAQRAVAAYGAVKTDLVAVYPTGTDNYPSAVAVALRTDSRGVVSQYTVYLEHFAVGWRVTWSPDWS